MVKRPLVARALAPLLIVLVGVMTLIPQALCPCAQRARAEAARAAAAGKAPTGRLCCERCRARVQAAAQTPAAPGEEAPGTCPCCEVNGKGKLLLQLGPSVRPPEHACVGFAVVPELAATTLRPSLVRASADAVDDAPDEAPPAITRAGVVLLI